MRERLASACLRLMKYTMLMGVLGRIAYSIGSPHHGLIKAGIGIIVEAMPLGNKLPSALKELRSITDEIIDEIFPK